jgi:RimJ/RimL family protein N-acetyltransferase
LTSLLPAEIRTARLVLQRQHPDDGPLIKDALDTSLLHLQAAVAWAKSAPTPLGELIARLTSSAAAFEEGTAWAYSVFDRSKSRVLGGVALEPADAPLQALIGEGAVELGYWLRADSTGYGYATEAAGALVQLALSRLHAPLVGICHDPQNWPSEGIPRRLGFRCFGVVAHALLPDRQAADGSPRQTTKVWVLDASSPRTADSVIARNLNQPR